jgi:integrase
MPLTDVAIRRAKPAAKPYKLFDGGGLYVEVVPAGGKWWRLKYRFGGKEKRLSLGTYPDTGLAQAREGRDKARKQLAAGDDPGAVRKATKAAQRAAALHSFEAVARAWLEHRSPSWTEDTRATIEASLMNHVFPELGERPIGEVETREVREVVKAIEAQGAGELALRVFQRVRSIFRYAVAHDLVETDPTYPLKPAEIFKPRRVAHRASVAEREAPELLRRVDAYEGDAVTRCALQLLLLTAVRPGELRGAQWDEIDEANAMWRVPSERMKMKTEHWVPLATQAVDLLRTLRTITGGSSFVFPSPYYPNKPVSDGTLNSALARLGYKGLMTAHGARTLFSTAANEAGWNSDVIEKQLSHEERDAVRGAYNRAQWLPERTKLMQWWADRLDKLRKGADVIPLRA